MGLIKTALLKFMVITFDHARCKSDENDKER